MPNKTQEQKMDEMTEVGVHPNHNIHDGRLQFQPLEKTIEFIYVFISMKNVDSLCRYLYHDVECKIIPSSIMKK